MSFKLELNTKAGKFSLDLVRDLDLQDMIQICQIADAMLNPEDEVVPYGPTLESHVRSDANATITNTVSGKSQTKLGEYPVNSINMGVYNEPKTGLRIKILEFVDNNRIPAFKVFQARAGISLLGAKDIVYGNYPCPILAPEVAHEILKDLKQLGIHAKAVDADESIAMGSRSANLDGLIGGAKRSVA